MKLPEYITAKETRRVCKDLKIRDWTRLGKPAVTDREAKIILKMLDTQGMKIDPVQFRIGLEVELEHGLMFREYNVTNNHPIITGKIVLAHFMEGLDYYRRLELAELEGDLLKAFRAGDARKTGRYYKRIAKAREELAKAEVRQL
jgi:hypothetical protein